MPSTTRVPRLAARAALVPLALTACGSSAASGGGDSGEGRDPDTLVLAAIPSEESTSPAQRYEPIIELLEDETGKEVTFQKATSYTAVIEAQRAGRPTSPGDA
ncbi:PhnD/SsuA/transferrin family substrate-binding protein [Streptomyces marincola]|uniref:PhnD/SsuA/transferrin family substrate-binding protein n=1 Tax=Streptomyces marincola TaxID=2878388 RepID=UPI001CF43924|nr:PhnD/SsuA/transferrin family substrate-binding protein [Streptomyces marincola]UCM91130.1 PhnD/SsuA/transferrin family substrate-binding protein [Streptomyces marincola]